MFAKLAAVAVVATLAIAPASAAVLISVENPGVTSTSANGTFSVETFNAATPAFQATLNETIGAVSFSYAGVDVRPSDIFGGVGGSNYAATYNGLNFSPYNASAGTYSLGVTSTGGPLNFFGAYFSAQDTNNQLSFYKNNTLVTSFTPAIVLNAISGTPAYTDGNGLINVFINFYFVGGDTYDSIVFDAAGNGTGFESDNHTVGSFVPPVTGTIITPVPEAQTWAMLVVGFGLVGFATRRKRVIAA